MEKYCFYYSIYIYVNLKGALMATRIIVNGKEVSNPVVRSLLFIGAVVIAALVTAIVYLYFYLSSALR